MAFDESIYEAMSLNACGMTIDTYAKHRATFKHPVCIILTDDYKNWCYDNNAKYYAEKDGHALITAHNWLAAYKDNRAPAIVLEATHWVAGKTLPTELLKVTPIEFQDYVEELQ